jgi:hypothetical protein
MPIPAARDAARRFILDDLDARWQNHVSIAASRPGLASWLQPLTCSRQRHTTSKDLHFDELDRAAHLFSRLGS